MRIFSFGTRHDLGLNPIETGNGFKMAAPISNFKNSLIFNPRRHNPEKNKDTRRHKGEGVKWTLHPYF